MSDPHPEPEPAPGTPHPAPRPRVVRIALEWDTGLIEGATGADAAAIWARIRDMYAVWQAHGRAYRGPKMGVIRPEGGHLTGGPMGETNGDRSTDAGLCRANGWKVGDILEGEEYGHWSRIRLTAIGEDSILARQVGHRKPGGGWVDQESYEGGWTLYCRDWVKVGPGAPEIAGG